MSVAVAHKQQCSVADLGGDKRLVGCDLSEAVSKMGSLFSLPCSLDKMTVLRQVMLGINQGVERGMADGSIPSTVMVGSDDLLPLVIYVLVQACAHKPAALAAPRGWCRPLPSGVARIKLAARAPALLRSPRVRAHTHIPTTTETPQRGQDACPPLGRGGLRFADPCCVPHLVWLTPVACPPMPVLCWPLERMRV